MPNIRLILLVLIVLAILFYLSTLISGGGMQKFDFFTDLGESVNTFTMYYMNGCPHCESILPEYRTFVASGQVENNGKKTKIRMLEQAEPAAAAELQANNVKGFPTFILSTVDGKTIEYTGERNMTAMRKFIDTYVK